MMRGCLVAALLCWVLGAACCAIEGPAPPSTQHAAPSTATEGSITAAVALRQYELAERLLREWVAAHEKDLDARFLLARVLAWQGKTPDALAEYDRLLAASPRDVDYLLGKAQTLTWGDRPAEAVPLLEEARSLAPRYEELYRAEIQALRKLGDQRRLAIVQDEAARLAPSALLGSEPGALGGEFATQSPEPSASNRLPAPGDAQRPGTRERAAATVESEAGFSHESLSHGYTEWRSSFLTWRKVFAARKTVYGMLRETERFSLVDRELMAGFSSPLGKSRTVVVEVSGSPTHRVLPAWSVLGLLQWDLGGGWDVQAGGRHTAYAAAPSDLGLVTFERYWKQYRAAYTLAAAATRDAGVSLSHRVQFGFYYGRQSTVGVGLAAGREVESLGHGRLLTSNVASLNLFGRHWLTPAWAITYEMGWHRQGELYTRKGWSIGLRHLFH
jgi:YaiO family outer membrane protein